MGSYKVKTRSDMIAACKHDRIARAGERCSGEVNKEVDDPRGDCSAL
jgi:hypothetical protein